MGQIAELRQGDYWLGSLVHKNRNNFHSTYKIPFRSGFRYRLTTAFALYRFGSSRAQVTY